jgi:pyruvate-ferredoxin/flavodoxin oxidoreductase
MIQTVETDTDLTPEFEKLLKNWDNPDHCSQAYESLLANLDSFENAKDENLVQISKMRNYIAPPSHWIIGGDGWAYDIGYGGLDHVLASGANVNILILDTEMYSNTGGQVSKSTPKGSYAKYAMKGKQQNKKDIGQIAMTYGHVYVASCSLAADYNQSVQAFREAESYNGPSLIITYATCVDWGHTDGADAMVYRTRLQSPKTTK